MSGDDSGGYDGGTRIFFMMQCASRETHLYHRRMGSTEEAQIRGNSIILVSDGHAPLGREKISFVFYQNRRERSGQHCNKAIIQRKPAPPTRKNRLSEIPMR